jgi:transcriptional regulator with XRE-family HTH domain
MKRYRALSAFGLNVRKQREAKQLTQERLAEKAELELPIRRSAGNMRPREEGRRQQSK